MVRIAATTYTCCAVGLIGFQLAMALGAPWGDLAMGGQWPGKFPPGLRALAAAQGLLIAAFVWIVLHRATIIKRPRAPIWGIWIVLGFATLGVVANLATPSAVERAIWAPVALAMWAAALVVYFRTSRPE